MTFRLVAGIMPISACGPIASYVDRIYAGGHGKGLHGARIIKSLRTAGAVDHIHCGTAGVFALGVQAYPMKNGGIAGLAPGYGGVIGG